MYKFLFTLIGIIFSTTLFAQTAMQALDQQLSNTQIFQAQFVQSTMSTQFGNQITRGEMTIHRPGKFRWQITEPDQQLLISDGDLLWVYDQDLEQVVIQRLSQRLDETPALLLAGKVDSLQQFFTVTEFESSESGDWYELRAREQEGLVNKVILNFDQGVIKEMQIFDNLGQRTDITFFNTKTNIKLADNYFSFTPPEGVDVISELSEFN